MKIGQSLSQCVLDIYLEKVDIKDVMVIITRTMFDPLDKEDWESIWEGYTNAGYGAIDYWSPYRDKECEFRAIVLALHRAGKLHQPRNFGAHPPRIEHIWLETIAPLSHNEHPSVKKAFEKYQTLAGLTAEPKEW